MKRGKEEEQEFEKPPLWLLEYVAASFGEDLDMVTKPSDIELVWKEWNLVCAPFDESHLWMEKAVKELQLGHNSIVFAPAAFNSLYWQDYVYPHAVEVRILGCPVRMESKKRKTVNQMCLVIFAPRAEGENEPLYSVIRPAGWDQQYYKRARNRQRFFDH